jgi:hypothetical protein
MLVLLTGCGAVKIGRIHADLSRYQNRVVHVNGTVTNSVGVLGTGGYQLEDETGKIYVVSRSGVPSRGSRVKVTGVVSPGGAGAWAAIREKNTAIGCESDAHSCRDNPVADVGAVVQVARRHLRCGNIGGSQSGEDEEQP